VKGCGVEVSTKGPFLKWQNRGRKVAKAQGRKGDSNLPLPPPSPEQERGSC